MLNCPCRQMYTVDIQIGTYTRSYSNCELEAFSWCWPVFWFVQCTGSCTVILIQRSQTYNAQSLERQTGKTPTLQSGKMLSRLESTTTKMLKLKHCLQIKSKFQKCHNISNAAPIDIQPYQCMYLFREMRCRPLTMQRA